MPPVSRRLRLFRLLLILTPVLILGIIEAGLRIFNYGPDGRLFVPYQEIPGTLIANPAVSERYLSHGYTTGFGANDPFTALKSDSTLRIFVLGGSTTAGFPYFFNGSFARRIQDRLESAYPAYTIEVINLGMTAVTSYTVREFARECLRQEPDLLILYTGHNEFYGALGSASTQAPLFGSSRSFTLLTLQLKGLKLFQLVQNLVRTVHTSLSGPVAPDPGTLMARLARRQTIPWDSPLYHRTRENFRANLEDILTWARRQQVPVLLGTLVSNLRDQHPFSSIPAPDREAGALAEALARVEELLRVKALDAARRELDSLLAQQPTHARLHFQAGRCAELAGDTAAAGEYYRQARDYDGLRFRAGSDFNGVLEALARREGVWLCDLERGFRAASPGGLIGKELLLEHLHPRLEGYFLMGKLLAGTILDHDLLEARGRRLPEPRPLPADNYFRETMAVTSLDLKTAQYQMAMLTSGWPFETAGRSLTLSELPAGTRLEKTALALLAGEKNYWEAHLEMTEFYQGQGDFEAALGEARALVKAFPRHWKSHQVLGKVYLNARRYEEALGALQQVLRLTRDGFSSKWIGNILLLQGHPSPAIQYLEQARRDTPEDPQILYNLTGAYLLTGDISKVREIIHDLERVQPEHPHLPDLRSQIPSP